MSNTIKVELDLGNSMTAKITMPNGKKFTITEESIVTPYRTVKNPSNDLVEELERFAAHVAKSDKKLMKRVREGISTAWDFAVGTRLDEEGNPFVLWESEVIINPKTGKYLLV